MLGREMGRVTASGPRRSGYTTGALVGGRPQNGLKTGLSPRDVTIENIFDRLAGVGDRWAVPRAGDPADLRAGPHGPSRTIHDLSLGKYVAVGKYYVVYVNYRLWCLCGV